MARHQPAMHRAILVADVEAFGHPARINAHQLTIRDALYKALTRSFTQAGISWTTCSREDRGDGVLVLIPPDVPKILLVTKLPARLVTALDRHNAASSPETQIRLRIALHAGEVHRDDYGVAGVAVNRAFRLVEAPTLKTALARSSGVSVLIVSDWFYDEVVRQDPAAAPSLYQPIHIEVKETQASAWMRVLHRSACGKKPAPPAPRQVAIDQF